MPIAASLESETGPPLPPPPLSAGAWTMSEGHTLERQALHTATLAWASSLQL